MNGCALPEAHGATQHATEHVVATVGTGSGAVGDGKRQGADVIRHDAVRLVVGLGGLNTRAFIHSFIRDCLIIEYPVHIHSLAHSFAHS